MKGEWIIGSCDGCNTHSFDQAPERQSEPRYEPRRPRPAPPADLSNLREIPSAVFVVLLADRELHRGGMVSCPLHDDSTPSLHVRDGDGGWFCHGCGLNGGIFEFFAYLEGRSVPTDRREFKRLACEIADALRGRA